MKDSFRSSDEITETAIKTTHKKSQLTLFCLITWIDDDKIGAKIRIYRNQNQVRQYSEFASPNLKDLYRGFDS